jgi:hypothetical protein
VAFPALWFTASAGLLNGLPALVVNATPLTFEVFN